MITVQIDESDALDMLIERLDYWTKDKDTIDLFEQMYTNYLENGLFDGCNFDVMAIVDNDYINYCSVIDESDPHFDEIMQAAINGDHDISCEGFGYSFIEAFNEDKGLILVRY